VGSLTSCLREAAEFLPPEQRAAILEAAARLRGEGMGVAEADAQAVREVLGKVDAGLKEVETARSEGRTLYEPAPEQAAEVAANPSRVEEVTRQFPDMMVKMDDMDEAMPASEFIAMAKAEADEMVADAPLLQVAAECALLHGV
jgi:hypothetical protein